MIARHVVTRRVVPALVIALAVLAFTGCPGVFKISPGGTFTVECYSLEDAPMLQVVVVFDPDYQVAVGPDYVYTFPVGAYEYPVGSGDIRLTQSFECIGVPAGDYFVYAFLDYDSDGTYEPLPSQEDSWVYGAPEYYVDASGIPPYWIAAPYPFPDPNYTVSSSYAAPIELKLSLDGR